MSTPMEQLPDLLRFHPKWWFDPVPWWFASHLDKAVLGQLAVVQLELQKQILGLQSKAIEQSIAIVRGVK